MGKEKKKAVKSESDFSDQPIADQFKRDAMVLKAYLEKNDKNNKTPSQKILQRTMLLLSAKDDVQFKNKGDKQFRSIAEMNDTGMGDHPQFNWGALVGHGGRVSVELSQDQMNEVINWLLNGSPDQPVNIVNRDKAIALDQGYYKRMFASHGADAEGNEKKLKKANPFHWSSFVSGSKVEPGSRAIHFGIDLGINGPEDGSHGQLYIRCDPGNPPDKKPTLQIGFENAAPLKEDVRGEIHGPDSVAKKVSFTGGAKFTGEQFEGYPIRPDDVDGKKIVLNSQDVATLKTKKAEDFDADKLAEPISKVKLKKEVEPTHQQSTALIQNGLNRERAQQAPPPKVVPEGWLKAKVSVSSDSDSDLLSNDVNASKVIETKVATAKTVAAQTTLPSTESRDVPTPQKRDVQTETKPVATEKKQPSSWVSAKVSLDSFEPELNAENTAVTRTSFSQTESRGLATPQKRDSQLIETKPIATAKEEATVSDESPKHVWRSYK